MLSKLLKRERKKCKKLKIPNNKNKLWWKKPLIKASTSFSYATISPNSVCSKVRWTQGTIILLTCWSNYFVVWLIAGWFPIHFPPISQAQVPCQLDGLLAGPQPWLQVLFPTHWHQGEVHWTVLLEKGGLDARYIYIKLHFVTPIGWLDLDLNLLWSFFFHI